MLKKKFLILLAFNIFNIKANNLYNLDFKLILLESEIRKLSSSLNKTESDIANINFTIENLKTDIKKLEEIYELKEKLTNLRFSEKINRLLEKKPWVILEISSKSTAKEAKEAFIRKITESKLDYLIIKTAYKNFLKINYDKKDFDLEFNKSIEKILKEKKELEEKIKSQLETKEKNRKKLNKKRSKLKSILYSSILDSINTANELNKINCLYNNNEKYLAITSICDININTIPAFYNIFSNLKSYINTKSKSSRTKKITKILSVINDLTSITLNINNIKLLADPEEFAKYKENCQDPYSDETIIFKYLQAAWLLINKIAPYLLLSRERDSKVLDIFDNPEKLKNSNYEKFYFIRELFKLSENLRKLILENKK